MAEARKQVCVSFLIRRDGDRVAMKVARADALGRPPLVEHEQSGPLVDIEDVFVATAAEYLKEIFMELKR